MKVTKKERSELSIFLADISSQASLVSMGATDEREKMYAKIDALNDYLNTAELEPEACVNPTSENISSNA